MKRLGAIFAGGQARRFGGDKAMALIDGQAMLDHVVRQLASQVDNLVIVGRDWPGLTRVDDLPRPGLGPLGALAGALAYARAASFSEVLTSGCDIPEIPEDLGEMLKPGPTVIKGQPLLALWPATLGDGLLDYLDRMEDRSMRGWIAESGARTIALPRPLANINTPEELAAWIAIRPADRRSSP